MMKWINVRSWNWLLTGGIYDGCSEYRRNDFQSAAFSIQNYHNHFFDMYLDRVKVKSYDNDYFSSLEMQSRPI